MGDVRKKKSSGGSIRLWVPLLVIAVVAVAGVAFAALALPGGRGSEPATQETKHSEGEMTAAGELAAGNNEFAFDLHRELAGAGGGNFTCSPYSVSVAMAMVHAGARGLSRDELTGALHFELDTPGLYDAFGVQNRLIDSIEGGTLANSAWVDQTFTLDPDYEKLIRGTFDSMVETLDFGRTGQAIARINGWTAETTHDRIRELLTSDDVDASTVLVLVNAIDLDMQWDENFNDRREGYQFTLADGSLVPVEMMQRKSECGYLRTDDYTAARLPFKAGDPRAMLVIVPTDPAGLAGLESRLDNMFLTGLVDGMYSTETEVFLPPFKLESRHNLIPALRAMGVEQIFGAGADLTGISGSEGRNIFVSAIIQQAMTEVDEEGVKAAAATAVVEKRLAMEMNPARLVADRPFLFIVRDTRTGAVLFTGRITDPTGLQG